MTFTEKKLPVARQDQFQFFATGIVAANGEMTETFDPGFAFELEKIRLHLSVVHPSVEDFTATLHNHIDSVYNHTLLSYAINGSQDVLSQFTPTFKCHSGDTINLSLILSSGNVYGLEISGWAITQAP